MCITLQIYPSVFLSFSFLFFLRENQCVFLAPEPERGFAFSAPRPASLPPLPAPHRILSPCGCLHAVTHPPTHPPSSYSPATLSKSYLYQTLCILCISSCICTNVARSATFPPTTAPRWWIGKKFPWRVTSGVPGVLGRGRGCESSHVCGLSRLILMPRMKRCHLSAFVLPLPRRHSQRGCQSRAPVTTLHQTRRSVRACMRAIWPAVWNQMRQRNYF